MANKSKRKNKNWVFWLVVANFILIISIILYILYVRFIPYTTIEYGGYAISGSEISTNLFNSNFDVDKKIKALKVENQSEIYERLNSYYVGPNKEENINLNYPIYVNDSVSICNLAENYTLITDRFQTMPGYSGTILNSGALYNSDTLKRADYYNYILLKNEDNIFVNSKAITVKTAFNNYEIPLNSIVNFSDKFITYYSLDEDEFVYNKIIDIDDESEVLIPDFKKKYTYNDFLIGLNLRIEETPVEVAMLETEEQPEDKKEEQKKKIIILDEEVNEPKPEILIIYPEVEQEEIVVEEPEKEENENSEVPIGWVKPTVECEPFKANVYSAISKISIKDPSRVIYKNVTFSFFKNGNIAFRTTTSTSGELKVTKLTPNTTYDIIGTFQYTSEDGALLESTFLKQTIETGSTDGLNPIELSITNGNIFSNKIELADIHIVSNIEDEAVNGVKSAEFTINGIKYNIDSTTLRKIANGKNVKYSPNFPVESNTKCEYEINFFDTLGNKMNVISNTGSTVTSKQIPSVKVKVSTQEVIKTKVSFDLSNKDNVELSDYGYILYSNLGEVISKNKLNINDKELEFENLNPQNTYTIKFFAGYNIQDGNGFLENQEIGNATFTTLSLSKLGNVKFEIVYDENTDLTYESANFRFGINTAKTDSRLLQILKNIKIQIKNPDKNVVKEINLNDISLLTNEERLEKIINNLNSDTTYDIVITATAMQGNVQEDVAVSYTLKNFTTKKKPVRLDISNLIITKNLIDMDIYVEDKDGACLENMAVIRFYDSAGKEYIPDIEPKNIKKTSEIPTNTWVRLTYNNLYENQLYEFSCEIGSYNETRDANKIQNNYKVASREFFTSGLGATIDLLGLERKKGAECKNLIDVKSETNWYSQCFDVLETEYEIDESYNVNFAMNSKYNYGKKYTEAHNNIEIELLSNQCYVYDFSNHIGETVTISFNGKVSDNNGNVYIQLGKSIGDNIEKIEGLNKNTSIAYQKTVVIPDDGYLGFYLAPIIQQNAETEEITYVDYNFYVDSLQVELGDVKTSYQNYAYTLNANAKISFIDESRVTYDATVRNCKYYVRLKSNLGKFKEFDYIYEGNESIEEIYTYVIDESFQKEDFVLEILIKQYNREYSLDQVEFNYDPETCLEIKSIENVDEFKNIQPYGNYVILNDLNLRNASSESEFTFGSPKIPFYGSIDFYGKTVSKDTYSIPLNSEITPYIFNTISDSAIIKNLVLDVYINNGRSRYTKVIGGIDQEILPEDGIYPLFLYNHGNIDNIMVNLRECAGKPKINVALMGYINYGKIENFIIKYEEKLYATKNIAGLCLFTKGVIQNGYLFGDGIETVGDMAISANRSIGGIVFQLDDNALMQNIYNLSGIVMNHQNETFSYGAHTAYNVGYPPEINEQTGSIIKQEESTAKVKNVYSVEPIITEYEDYTYYGCLDDSNKEDSVGPNILNSYTQTKVDGSRYFCDVTYGEDPNNIKSPATSLYEPGVQDAILNTNGYNQFIIDKYVTNGFYPHLKLNYCMPEQINVKIELKGIEIIDVLTGSVVENNDISTLDVSDKVRGEIQDYITQNEIDINDENVSIVEFRIYNPAGTTITEINMKYVDAEIMSQTYSKKVSTVYAILRNPSSYLDEYDVESIQSKRANGKILESVYGEMEDLGRRIIPCRFIKYISTAEEWNNINIEDENGVSGLIQNYRLVNDIDFSVSDATVYIEGTFTGFLDGSSDGVTHTLKGIKGNKSIFSDLDDCIIQNLNVDGYIINTSENKAGFVANITPQENVTLNNIHIKNMEINSSYNGSSPYYGGICGCLESNSDNEADRFDIINCGIQGFNVEFDNNTVTNVVIGGIVGYDFLFGGVDLNINNCFVQGFYVEADVMSTTGIGGILGYDNHNSNQDIKPGTPRTMITNCYTTGKINTKIKAGGILGYSKEGIHQVERCYSTMNLNSTTTSGAVYIGGIAGYNYTGATPIKHNMYLGNIYVSGTSVTNLNRILGNNAGTTANNNYAFLDQIMNGETSTTVYGATKLLTEDEIYSANTYDNLLDFDENYAFENTNDEETYSLLENGYLPLLNYTDGGLQPYQKNVFLDNDLKLDSIVATPSEDKTEVTVVMKFENKKDLPLVNVEIENDDMTIKDGTWNVEKDENDLSVVTFVATPNKAFDSYKISKIFYERNGEILEKEIPTKIKVELFKGISNAQEWNDFFDGEGRTYPGQNVKILGNIDFSTVDHISSKVVIGKIEADQKFTISNVNLTLNGSSQSFISEIKTSLKNIDFANSTIKGTGSYNGLIGILRGAASSCNFNNIEINFTGNYDYIGIIPRCISGSFTDINISNVKVYGRHYLGGLCGQTTSMGASKNIKGTYLYINGTGNYIAGIIGYSTGSITNMSAYQYSATGKQSGDTETAFLAKGSQFVGGCIGRYNGGNATYNGSYCDYSLVQGTNYVGANVGYTYGNTNNFVAKNNTVKASGSYSGGNVGYVAWYTNRNYTSERNTISAATGAGGNIGGVSGGPYTLRANNNSVNATTYSGGSIGYIAYYGSIPYDMRVYGSDTQITGKNYVGGAVGRSTSRIRNIKVENVTISSTGSYTGGIVGHNNYNTTSISATSIGNYSLAGGYAKNLTITSTGSYVGGVSGYELGTIYGAVAENCTISTTGNYAGGLAGFYSGYDGTSGSQLSASTYFLWNSYCMDSSVRAANYAGGIVGYFRYGNIQYCYLGNTSVTATATGAGGFVGYFDDSKMNNLQYKATIKYNYIANTSDEKSIIANNSVGGIIGVAAKKINYDEDIDRYNNIECNLLVTDLKCKNSYIDMGIGSIAGTSIARSQGEYMNNIYIYNCSCINGVQVGGITDIVNTYYLVSSGELSTSAIYTRNIKTDNGNEGLNFGTARFDYTNGYFPILKVKYSSAETYWASNSLNVPRTKIAVPNRTEEFDISNLETLDSVISRTKADITILMANMDLNRMLLPSVYVYASDIDKLNIEFEKTNPDTYFELRNGEDVIIEKQPIDDRVYTISYDYMSNLNLRIINEELYDNILIEKENTRNLLYNAHDEYYYLAENKIYSNKRNIDGEFANLFDGKGLNTSGEIIDLKTGEIIGNVSNEYTVLDEDVPVTTIEYNGTNAKTYYHCTKIINTDVENYKNQQIFIKNDKIYLIDGKFNNIGNSVILDSYNGKQYESTLGTDGKIYDLLTPIKYPSNFENAKIKAMSNNIDSDENVVMVYYSYGKVCAFNYVTGEIVYNNEVEEPKDELSFSEFIAQNVSPDAISYNINIEDYDSAQELIRKLEDYSIEEALEQINSNSNNVEQEDIVEENVDDVEEIHETSVQYIPTYNPITQDYIVYSTTELFNAQTPNLHSENYKINANDELIEFYSGASNSKKETKNFGIIIIAITIGTVCCILLYLSKKVNKQ